jgi:enoyl-CoA hydratase
MSSRKLDQSPASDVVLVERIGTTSVVTLNRPEAMNALSRRLCERLSETILELDSDESVRVIVLTGAGNRAFSAGIDLKELGREGVAVLGAVSDEASADPVAAIGACRKPVIAAVNGVAVTGGFELALACDIIVCGETARFADTHVKVGVLPGWGLSQRLSRIVGPSRAKEISLTGRFIDAHTALAWGLVNSVFPIDSLLAESLRLAELMGEHSPTMVNRYKQLINSGGDLSLSEALKLEQTFSRLHNRNIDAAAIDARRNDLLIGNRSSIRNNSTRMED